MSKIKDILNKTKEMLIETKKCLSSAFNFTENKI